MSDYVLKKLIPKHPRKFIWGGLAGIFICLACDSKYTNILGVLGLISYLLGCVLRMIDAGILLKYKVYKENEPILPDRRARLKRNVNGFITFLPFFLPLLLGLLGGLFLKKGGLIVMISSFIFIALVLSILPKRGNPDDIVSFGNDRDDS